MMTCPLCNRPASDFEIKDFKELIAQRSRDLDGIAPFAAKALARSRLISSGIHFRDEKGVFRLHPNYGGDPINTAYAV